MTAIQKYRAAFNASFPERNELGLALLCARIAGENLLILGPPGTAKTTSVRAFANSLGERTFYVQLHRQLPETDIFGPVDVSKFKSGQYVRKVAGYAPEAECVVLDEVFKAGPTTLNPLLTLLESRMVKQDGVDTPAKLKFAVGISNELPGEGDDLSAFHDRFPLRVWVDYIVDDKTFALMSDGMLPAFAETLDKATIGSIEAALKSLPFTDAAHDAVRKVILEARSRGIAVSDRRATKGKKLMRALAAIEGAKEVRQDHIKIFRSILWNKKEEIPTVEEILRKCVSQWLKDVQDVNKILDELKANLRAAMTAKQTREHVGTALIKITGEYKRIKEEEIARIKAHGPDTDAAVADILARIKAESREVIEAGVRLGIGTFIV